MADEYLNQIDENEKDKLIDLVVPNDCFVNICKICNEELSVLLKNRFLITSMI